MERAISSTRIARRKNGRPAPESKNNGNGHHVNPAAEPIAIIGMSGRFPGAPDVDQLWTNLAHGVESITVLSQEDMLGAGVPESIWKLPGYVNAASTVDGVDQFDAQFFGFSARDAALTDPQHRLFLETAWQALEDAGYDPSRFPGPIGVFGGCELSSYLYHLYQNLESLKYIDGMQLMVTNDKDHLCTQISYRLNLRGPSVAVQTTCSTSLVAVSLACESLHHRRCDMALAGGVTVKVPQRGGYFYTAGSILSPDGHCRPFDARAQGTIVGSGSGMVVLRRLSDAIEQGDHIRAVILGAGINNDGNDKVGYTAPSTRGQAAAIRAAHRAAGVTADTISFVEAHGTGTILGDPIELSALTEVFRESTSQRGFCAIGSAKSNFGHLSCAAGVAGLIKTVLSLEHQAIPPTVHYTAPNPALNLAASPFYITTRLQSWERNGVPRRAGVSSFGVGGTNAHLVLEEAPVAPQREERRPHQVFTVSARSEGALNEATRRLAEHLRAHPEIDLADAAHTLHAGRKAFQFRRTFVTASSDRLALLEQMERAGQRPGIAAAATSRPVVFMFPGQGSQYPGMAEGLYETEPVVRRAIDRCARLLKPALDADLRKLLFPSSRKRKDAAEALKDTKWAQPALFTVGYALAELWSAWGIQPAAMIGHSVGEYVAATLAGVMSVEDALALIARRGQLISELPRGSMVAVMSTPEKLGSLINGSVSIAAVNAPGFAVLSGAAESIARLEQSLSKEGIPSRHLHTSHAFHSAMMDPILEPFGEAASRVTLSAPSKPFVSTLTGEWAATNVAQPEYWCQQLRQAVRFGDALRQLAGPGSPAGKEPIYLEAGPGNTLCTFAREVIKETKGNAVCLTSLPGPDARRADTEETLWTLGQLWSYGVDIDWETFHATERRSRVSLPTYPFERQSYWVGTDPNARRRGPEARDPFNWFYRPVWREQALRSPRSDALAGRRVLVLEREGTPASALVEQLRGSGCDVAIARPSDHFESMSGGTFLLNPKNESDFKELARAVCASEARLAAVVDCWSATPLSEERSDAMLLDAAAEMSLLAPMRLAHALSREQTIRPLPVVLVAKGTTKVEESDRIEPTRALSSGIARVLPQEYRGLRVSHVDIDDAPESVAALVTELAAETPDPAIAVRRGKRYTESFDPVVLRSSRPATDLPQRPVILMTGGLGHIGLNLAEALMTKLRARMVLMGRTHLPPPEQWAAKSEATETPHAQKALLQRLVKMRENGGDVLVLNADLNDPAQVQAAVDAALEHYGQVDVVAHGAARIDAAAFGSISETNWDVVEAQFSPKLRGLFSLMDAFRDREPRRWILHSSISTVLGGLNLGAYSAANAVLDALALQSGSHWLSIDWDAWDNAAEAQSASLPTAIQPEEGKEALLRLFGSWEGSRVLVAIGLEERLKAWVQHADITTATSKEGEKRHARPNLTTAFVEPRNQTEELLAEIWGSQLGLESVGIYDRFFDLGGHSLLAAQIAAEICDRCQIELPVVKIFQAPTIAELAVVVDQAKLGTTDSPEAALSMSAAAGASAGAAAPELQGDAPEVATKLGYREFYNDVSRRLAQSGMGAASFFLNYGYKSSSNDENAPEDEACVAIPAEVFNRNSVRLAFELVGNTPLAARKLLDVGCGRGGTVALLAETFDAVTHGVDLSPEAIAFCRKTHTRAAGFEVGDAEHLPFEDQSFDVVTNMESSHTYPNLRAFFSEVYRVLAPGGTFLYTDLLPVQRWAEVRMILEPLGFQVSSERDITANVLASCDDVAANRTKAFGGSSEMIDNFLAVPGSMVYEQMNSGAWQYRILRATRR